MPNQWGIPTVGEVNSIRTNGNMDFLTGIADYFTKQNQTIQNLQAQQASELSQAKTRLISDPYYAPYASDMIPKIDSVLSNNPYGKRLVSPQGQPGMGQALQGQGQPGMPMYGGMSAGGISSAIQNPYVMGQGGGTPGQSSGTPSNGTPSSSPVLSGMTRKTPFGDFSFSVPSAKAAESAAGAQGEVQGKASVTPELSKISAAQSAGGDLGTAQAQSSQNIARDTSQMDSVFATLKNLHDIHSTLSDHGFAGTDLGELAQNNLSHVGTAAFLFGQNPTTVQRNLISKDDQNLIGQYQSGLNEGITRAVQPMQNQVDTKGSSRIMESMVEMMKQEYPTLKDPQDIADGKMIATGKTLYRMTLASQNYDNLLRAQGVTLKTDPNTGNLIGKDSQGNQINMSPQDIASRIKNNADNMQFTPAQKDEFNTYANNMMGTKNYDYSTGVGVPQTVGRPQFGLPQQGQQPRQTITPQKMGGQQVTTQIAQQLLNATGNDPAKARILAKNMGYSF